MKSKSIIPVIKPVGLRCNLKCSYCWYDKVPKLPYKSKIMSFHVLESLIKRVIHYNQEGVMFEWHGGEPMLAPITFYRKVLEFQETYKKNGQQVINYIQSNGTLLNDEWILFLKENNFKIGLSIDGPKEIHEKNRPKSFDQVMEAVQMLQAENMVFGVIATINSTSVKHPDAVYSFFKDHSIKRISLKPCYNFNNGKLDDLSVDPLDYAQFMIRICDLWLEDNDPTMSIKEFNNILLPYFGGQATNCSNKICACQKLVNIDYDGNVYSCNDSIDNFRDFSYGNIVDSSLDDLFQSENFRIWDKHVQESINYIKECLDCQYLKSCGGGCVKVKANFNINFRQKYCQSRKFLISYLYDKAQQFINLKKE